MNGIINIYKEKGFTSFDVVAKLRGIAHQKKIGHTGTLDPDAEGVLPVCLGKATKVCSLLTDKDKEYEAVLLLGKETDTQDVSGTVLRECVPEVTKEQVVEAIASFVGSYEQTPPMYSALKVNGQKLCDLARKGITVERNARTVQIHRIDILSVELPRVRFLVHCSKGTYIRTLCHDIGRTLGCFGCMESLLRTRVAQFRLEDAHRLSEVERFFKEGRGEELLCPVDHCFLHCPALFASKEADKLIQNGNRIPSGLLSEEQSTGTAESCRVYDADGTFVGLYSYQEDCDDYKPVKLFL